MPYSSRVKSLAYRIDPSCWKSYSGKLPSFKRAMDARRTAALTFADNHYAGKYIDERDQMSVYALGADYANIELRVSTYLQKQKDETTMTPIQISMMLHFYYCCGPYPEPTRRSQAYVEAVRKFLREGLIERPSDADRRSCPGWAYRATEKGRVYVKALTEMPLPVQTEPKWVMPS